VLQVRVLVCSGHTGVPQQVRHRAAPIVSETSEAVRSETLIVDTAYGRTLSDYEGQWGCVSETNVSEHKTHSSFSYSVTRVSWGRTEIQWARGRIDTRCQSVERVCQPSPERMVAVGGRTRPTRTVSIARQALAELRIVEDDAVTGSEVFHSSALLIESSTTRHVFIASVWADWAVDQNPRASHLATFYEPGG
jgi:hypothetical protein